jgi:hypothetical protein
LYRSLANRQAAGHQAAMDAAYNIRRKSMTDSTTKKPEKQFRIGFTGASIWRNTTEEGKTFYSVTINRMYRNGDDIRHTDNFNHDDLLNVARLAERAEAYIARKLAE